MPTPQPVNLVSLEAVTVSYGVRRVLDDVSLGVAGGDRVGVVGRNGDGKSTLVELIAGRTVPQAGRGARAGGLTTGLLAQHDELDEAATVRAAVLGDHPEHVWAADPRAREVVGSLLAGIDLDTLVGTMSGGERRRAALAHLLVRDHDVLVLDEPTNHLDLTSITWLAEHLVGRYTGQRRRALVVVTHDRWFLDAVCETTWDVHDGVVSAYEGGYAAYVLERAERVRVAEVRDARRRNLLTKELAWLRRGPPARTSKPKFRIDAANALIDDEPAARDSLALSRLATARLGRKVLELHDIVVERGGRRLLDHVEARWGAGERIGIVGPNGAGKTTLISVVTGDLTPDSGRVERGSTVRIAHLSQRTATLDLSATVLGSVEGLHRVATADGGEVTPTSLLERFGFTGERLVTRVGDLSGGERRRLEVLRLLLGGPNLLLMDEPTNDLDIDTLTVLEDFLDGWPGSVVVVSHDRYFLERVCDTIWALPGDGTFEMLPGGVDQYVTAYAFGGRRGATPTAGPVANGSARVAQSAPPPDRRAARKELVRLERQIARLTSREATLHDDLVTAAADYQRLVTLGDELDAVVAEREQLEEAWLEAAELAEDP